VVLIDTVDKASGWKILRTGNDRKGLLGLRQLARLNALAERYGIKVLWAGGITLAQAYEFGKLGVFGIYVTTAAARSAPVRGTHRRERGLPAMKVPTFEGVLRTKILLETGFLVSRDELPGALRARIGSETEELLRMIATPSNPDGARDAQTTVEASLGKGWRAFLRGTRRGAAHRKETP
jgi:hypothetical protein